MRLLVLLTCASLGCAGVAAANADDELTTTVLAFRLDNAEVDAVAWRGADGALYADRATLESLRIAAPGDGVRVALASVPGLHYRLDEAHAAVQLSCSSACFAERRLGGASDSRPAVNTAQGGFFNADLSATDVEGRGDLAGAFDFGLFGPYGVGETSWVLGTARGQSTRLETQWTFDTPASRTRLRLGDAIARGGATGLPFRFGGVQLASDFSLDPGFITYPTPALRGSAAAPSTVDLFVDGALRMRDQVDAGPFSIIDAPVLIGAGTAQIVVTDALGRQQIYATPFYTSPLLLRRGLLDYSLALGAERRGFGRESADYGRGFLSGLARYGLSDALTGEARFEAANDFAGAGAAASLATYASGQIDLALAHSEGGAAGNFARLGWSRTAPDWSFGLDIATASRGFRRLGDDRAPAQVAASAYVGANLRRFGTASAAFTADTWRDAPGVRTLALSYTPPQLGDGGFALSALYVDAERSNLTLGLTYSAALGGAVSAHAEMEQRDGRLASHIGAQRAPDPDGGFGWRGAVAQGDFDAINVELVHLGAAHQASLAYSRLAGQDGLRGQLEFGVAWIGHDVVAGRRNEQSFALVDAGAPHVGVLRDRTLIGYTNADGRLLVTGLRPYERNRVGIALDDLPPEETPAATELEVTPAARSGVVVTFNAPRGASGEVRVLDARGAPLPAGAMLTRASDGARFPVADGGRAYLTGVDAPVLFRADGCVLDVAPAAVRAGATLRCAAS